MGSLSVTGPRSGGIRIVAATVAAGSGVSTGIGGPFWIGQKIRRWLL